MLMKENPPGQPGKWKMQDLVGDKVPQIRNIPPPNKNPMNNEGSQGDLPSGWYHYNQEKHV